MNNTFHSAIKNSPSKLLLGYDQRNHGDAALVQYLKSQVEVVSDFSVERETYRKPASEAKEKLQKYNKIYYDKKHTKPTRYNPGDYVLIRDTSVKSE